MLAVTKVIVSNHPNTLHGGTGRKANGFSWCGMSDIGSEAYYSVKKVAVPDGLAKRLLGVLRNQFEFPKTIMFLGSLGIF